MTAGICKSCSRKWYWLPRQLTLKLPDRPAIYKWGIWHFWFSDKNQVIKTGGE
jgi:hypothetical protein